MRRAAARTFATPLSPLPPFSVRPHTPTGLLNAARRPARCAAARAPPKTPIAAATQRSRTPEKASFVSVTPWSPHNLTQRRAKGGRRPRGRRCPSFARAGSTAAAAPRQRGWRLAKRVRHAPCWEKHHEKDWLKGPLLSRASLLWGWILGGKGWGARCARGAGSRRALRLRCCFCCWQARGWGKWGVVEEGRAGTWRKTQNTHGGRALAHAKTKQTKGRAARPLGGLSLSSVSHGPPPGALSYRRAHVRAGSMGFYKRALRAAGKPGCARDHKSSSSSLSQQVAAAATATTRLLERRAFAFFVKSS